MSKKQITTRGIVFLKRYGMKLIFLPVMVVLIVPRAGFTQESKPVTSWKDIVIGKTTEDEIISRNPEGSVEISFRGWSKIKQGQNGLHRLEFVTECSYAEDKNKIDKFTSQMVKNGIDKDTADFLTGQTDQKDRKSVV